MKILEVFGEPISRGGQESYLISALNNMNRTNLKIDFFTPYYCDNTDFIDFSNNNKCTIYEANLPFNPGKSRKNVIAPLKDYLKKNNYDIVHIHSGSNTILGYCAMVAKKAGVKKVIVHSHSSSRKNDIKHFLVVLYTAFFINNYSTDFFACSKLAARSKFIGKALKSCKIALNGIETEKYKFNPEIRRLYRKKYNINEQTFVIGNVGRFVKEKNQLFLVELLKKLYDKDDKCDIKLVLVGDGLYAEKIKNKIDEYGLQDNVILIGSVTNVCDYLQMMDIFAFPSLFEGLGIVAVEAEASGLPVVASTNIPDDIKLTNDVCFAKLNDIEKWESIIIGYKEHKRKDLSKIIKNSGFDVKDTSKILRDCYIGG